MGPAYALAKLRSGEATDLMSIKFDQPLGLLSKRGQGWQRGWHPEVPGSGFVQSRLMCNAATYDRVPGAVCAIGWAETWPPDRPAVSLREQIDTATDLQSMHRPRPPDHTVLLRPAADVNRLVATSSGHHRVPIDPRRHRAGPCQGSNPHTRPAASTLGRERFRERLPAPTTQLSENVRPTSPTFTAR